MDWLDKAYGGVDGRSAAMATTWLLTGSPFMPRTDSVTLPSRQSMSTVPKLAAP